jgi:cholesterol oxidase
MNPRWDVIVIGSGFGGAVTACRLTAAGAKVLVLERGRRWTKPQYPRKLGDPWLFNHARPHRHNGWLDVRLFKRMTVLMGAGVGGGSLCYSSVLLEPHEERFRQGWPGEITPAELKPHYQTVREMLAVRTIPTTQLTQRSKLLRRGAEKIGAGDRFFDTPLALSFDPQWNYQLPDPLDPRHSKPFINDHGQRQGTCIHLGNCDIGCDVHAKNTLDLNYLAMAERNGAEIRPLHSVRRIAPLGSGGGYRVFFDRVDGNRLVQGSEDAGKIVLAAGSLGSTELLLRCRDLDRTLPGISGRLGESWSANANVLTPDVYPNREDVQQSIGPTITSALDFSDGSVDGQRFILEDDGFPNLLLNASGAMSRFSPLNLFLRLLHAQLRRGTGEANVAGRVAVWLGAGVDGGDGRLSLSRPWCAPWRKKLSLRWNVKGSKPVIDAILAQQQQISDANGGSLRIPLYWRLLKASVTVHPLGGCKMGRTSDDGVVDHRGQVFGHPGLFVSDGAIIPRPVGRNPSLLIAALAERAAALMLHN